MKKHLIKSLSIILLLILMVSLKASEQDEVGRISLLSSRELTPEAVEVITGQLFQRGVLSCHGYGFSRVKSDAIAQRLNDSLDWADMLGPTPEYPSIEPNSVVVIKKAESTVLSVNMSVTLEKKLISTVKQLWKEHDESPLSRDYEPPVLDGPELSGINGELFYLEMDSDE